MKTLLKLSLLVLLVIGSYDLFALTGPSFLDVPTEWLVAFLGFCVCALVL
jgi:hypothetical protein